MKIEFLPAAVDDLIEAAERYEGDVAGLGREFVSETERVIGVLVELPALGERLDETHRCIPLRRFPYALIFRRDQDVIRIVAVAHRRRRPRYWAPRVHDRANVPNLTAPDREARCARSD